MRAFLDDFVAFAGPWRLAAAVALMLAGGVVEGVSLALLVPLLAVLTGEGGGTVQRIAGQGLALIGVATPFARLGVLVGTFTLAMAGRALVLMLRDRRLNALQARYVEHRRLRLLEALADAEWRRVAGLRHARVSSALTNDIGRVAIAAHTVLHISVAAVMLAVQVALTLVVSWRIGLLVLAALAAGGAVAAARLGSARLHGEKLGRDGLAMAHTAAQLLGGLKLAVAEHRQHGFVRDFAAASAAMVDRQIAYQRRVTRFQLVVSMAVAVGSAAVLLAGAWVEADRAALLATLVILFRMVAPATGLQRDAEMLATTIPADATVRALETELRAGTPRPAAGASARVPVPAGVLELDRATFLHDGGAGVRAVSLRIAPGEVVGVTGASGAGKTTLVDLLAGLLEPQSGAVRVGGVPLVGMAAAGWRGRIAYIGQDAFLTGDTIRRNLADGGADEAEMWAALAVAAVAETVRVMPDGLDTGLAERGARLSGGERQRVAIARGLLRRPALLILDEATNAIDVATEDRVLAALAALDPAPAIVVVAHRRETLRRCTRILEVADGRLVADRPADAGAG